MLKAAHLPPATVIASSLINELDQIKNEFILVLDDYHLIRDKNVHGLMAKLLEHPSAFLHLVIIGRRDPPLPLTSLRARGRMVEVRTQDLRFSLDETVVFLQQMTGAPIDRSVATLLEEKTEGWVTGLRLAALSLRHRKDFERILSDLPLENRYVMDYIVNEILTSHPQAIQECILKASVLSRFCAPLCDAVCLADIDTEECSLIGQELLELLDQANLFVIPLDDERKWFRYHHLFQAVLKRRLKQSFKFEDISKLYKLASSWFAEHGYIEEALSHALESGNRNSAAELIKTYRHEIMNREQWYHLNRWVQKFPPDFIQNHPDLLLAKAWVFQRQARYVELFDILSGLERMVSICKEEASSESILCGEVQALKSFQYYSTARAELAEISAREALERLPVRYHSSRGFALIILSLALQMQGQSGQAQHVVHEALQQEVSSTPVYKTMLLAALCYASWIAADLNNLKPAAAQLLKHGQRHGLPETIAVGRFFSGILHYQLNELDMAEHFLSAVVGHPVAGELVVPSIVTYCQSSLALSLTYQAMGRDKDASEIIESVIGYMLESGNADLLEICQVFKAELALRQGKVAEADLWAKNYAVKPLAPAYRFYTPHLALPKVLISRRTSESLREAAKLLSRIYDYYVPIHNARVLIDILSLQSLLNAAQGNASIGFAKLEEALALAEPGGFVRPFLDQGPEMADIMGDLVGQDPAQEYAKKILDVFQREKTAPSLPEAVSVDPLTNREIEVLRTLATGLSNNEIADILFISPETVKRHLSTIYSKLDVKNRQQAVISAKSIGIL
jgi:LuxR family maltose regulon positive regulatory protein